MFHDLRQEFHHIGLAVSQVIDTGAVGSPACGIDIDGIHLPAVIGQEIAAVLVDECKIWTERPVGHYRGVGFAPVEQGLDVMAGVVEEVRVAFHINRPFHALRHVPQIDPHAAREVADGVSGQKFPFHPGCQFRTALFGGHTARHDKFGTGIPFGHLVANLAARGNLIDTPGHVNVRIAAGGKQQAVQVVAEMLLDKLYFFGIHGAKVMNFVQTN